jgi:hypothetical protein
MAGTRAYHTATLLSSGKVLLAGGMISGSTAISTAELFDPAAGTNGQFSTTGSMHVARCYHVATLLADNTVLIIGGSPGNPGASHATAEIFDPTANSGAGAFGSTIAMKAGHSQHAAVLLSNGSVLVAGNYDSSSPAPPVPVGNSSEIFTPFDPETGTAAYFSSTPDPMTTVRSTFQAVRLDNGTVLLPGGLSFQGSPTPTVESELYVPSSYRVTPAGHAFGDTPVGTTSASQTFTIDAFGSSLSMAPFTITGTNSSMFLSSTNCATQTLPPVDPDKPSLAAGESCFVYVTFTPTSAGAKLATLVVGTDDPWIPTREIPLSGTGVVASTLTVNYAGAGDGSINSDPPGIACSDKSASPCQGQFAGGTQVTLHQTADSNSLFSGWSGASCAGTDPCVVTLTANTSVTATFNHVKPAKISGTGSYFDTLQAAYDSAIAGGVVQAREHTFTESPVFNGSGLVTINGGYDLSYSTNSGTYSVVDGVLTVGTGGVVLSNIVVQ